MLNLVHYFGASNVYISIYESGSWDNSKGALRELDTELAKLDVPRTITLDEKTHQEELAHPPSRETEGWIQPPKTVSNHRKWELRRIPYLARLRNLSLKPLDELEKKGNTTTRFDKILFLNDVVFTTADIRTLLATRDGDYAAACSLDYSKPPAYYDTFALRDAAGHEAANPTFPYFRDAYSRAAIMRNEPVPVQSCWNGIAVFDAAPFYGEAWDGRAGAQAEDKKEINGIKEEESTAEKPKEAIQNKISEGEILTGTGSEGVITPKDHQKPKSATKRTKSSRKLVARRDTAKSNTGGLRFRGLSDSLARHHVEGSECCLIHIDNPLSATRGVWVNPAVRVGYSGEAYDAVHASPLPSSNKDTPLNHDATTEGLSKQWMTGTAVVRGIWGNRFRRWTRSVAWKERRVKKRVQAWRDEGAKIGEEREERGTVCLINEMQVLRENGWAHV